MQYITLDLLKSVEYLFLHKHYKREYSLTMNIIQFIL